MDGHSVFTDFLIYVGTHKIRICLWRLNGGLSWRTFTSGQKNRPRSCMRPIQCFRTCHTTEPCHIILTNSSLWSLCIAKKVGDKIGITSTLSKWYDPGTASVEDYKSLISLVLGLIEMNFSTSVSSLLLHAVQYCRAPNVVAITT